MNLAVIAKNAVRSVKHRSPIILTGLGVAGVVSTVILAVKATPAAIKRIDIFESKENGLWIKSSPKERVLLLWDLYVPAAVTGSVTIACIIGAQSVNMRRQAALVGAFTITEGAFQEYKDQVVETFGKSKAQKVHDDVIQKKITAMPPSDLVVIGEGNVLCKDDYSGRYFESTMEKIRKAQNDFNEQLLNGEMYSSLNEFYSLLGLEEVNVGEQVGFSPENLMNIIFSTAMTPDGRPCLAISFRALPRQDYDKLL